jgi:hypothetical protein
MDEEIVKVTEEVENVPEESEKEKKFRISDEDFIMEEIKKGSHFFNLVFMKKVKRRNTGNIEIEPGKPMYGVPFINCINRIIHHKTKKKFEGRTLELKDLLAEYFKLKKELTKLFEDESKSQ